MLPQSPRLTLASEVASLLNFKNDAEIPATLYHGGVTDGSTIALKGTEGRRHKIDPQFFAGLTNCVFFRGNVGPHSSWYSGIQSSSSKYEVGSKEIFIVIHSIS